MLFLRSVYSTWPINKGRCLLKFHFKAIDILTNNLCNFDLILRSHWLGCCMYRCVVKIVRRLYVILIWFSSGIQSIAVCVGVRAVDSWLVTWLESWLESGFCDSWLDSWLEPNDSWLDSWLGRHDSWLDSWLEGNDSRVNCVIVKRY